MQQFLANQGQYVAGAFAVLAAFFGIASSWASNEAAKDSNEKLFRATAIIERLSKQVGIVIGDEWRPLDVNQIDTLRQTIATWPKPERGIHVMYETEFGKALAESLALAFRAAGWQAKVTTGAGFGRGIEVGWGQYGARMKDPIASVTGCADVRVVNPDASGTTLALIGIGANVQPEN